MEYKEAATEIRECFEKLQKLVEEAKDNGSLGLKVNIHLPAKEYSKDTYYMLPWDAYDRYFDISRLRLDIYFTERF